MGREASHKDDSPPGSVGFEWGGERRRDGQA